MRFSVALAALFVATSFLHAEDWPEFRGPDGQGHYKGRLPTEWGPDKNVVWKQAIPGSGWSSPVIFDGRIYLTTAVPAEKGGGQSLRVLCLDAKSGRTIWDVEALTEDAKSPGIHGKNSHASPTPIVDGKYLYVHFGHQGTACLDLNGKVVWTQTDLRYQPVHGNGGSPALAGDLLVFSIDSVDKQCVVALDRATGKVRWQTDRKSKAPKTFSFTTPLVIDVGSTKQVISPGSDMVMSLDAKTGAEIWRVTYTGYSVIPRPVFGHGLVFLSTSFNSPSVLAIRPDGKGDVTKSHVAWSTEKNGPHTPSLLLDGDELYMISDGGTASCLDAKTGKVHWEERLRGGFSASPILADGRIYFQNETGVGYVVKAGTKYELISKNDMKEKTLASYAAADGALFLRTEKNLYQIK
jgi:outer membrane protein assembly factor BamB